jgi:hypothetical protein
MKLLQNILPILTALAWASIAHGENPQQFLTDGQVALQRGDLETAKRNFDIVIRIDPANKTAIGFLKQIKVQEAKAGGGAAVEKALSQLVIPKIEFKEATLSSALDFLKRKVNDVSAGKQSVNFVVQPGVDQNGTLVTLSVTGLPFTEALRYLGEVANVSFTYQQYAILVRARGSATATNNPAPVKDQ